MPERDNSFTFADTRDFVRKVYEEQYEYDHQNPGGSPFLLSNSCDSKPNPSTPSHLRRPNIALLYTFGDKTREELRKVYGISRERSRQDHKKFIHDLWYFASPELQQAYPLHQLILTKDYFDLSEVSETGKKRMTRIVANGLTQNIPHQELRKKYGSSRVAATRPSLKKIGIELPETKLPKQLIVDEINNPETSLERLCELIKNFNYDHAIARYSSGEDPILFRLTDLQKEAWGVVNRRITAKVQTLLEQWGLPVHAVRHNATTNGYYRFTFTRVKQIAIEKLSEMSL